MEIDWKSVAREGNPLTEGDYFVTIITESGKYDTQIGTWQRGYWIFETSVVIAYTQNQSHTNASCLRQGRGLCFSRLFPAHCKDYNYIFQQINNKIALDCQLIVFLKLRSDNNIKFGFPHAFKSANNSSKSV